MVNDGFGFDGSTANLPVFLMAFLFIEEFGTSASIAVFCYGCYRPVST